MPVLKQTMVCPIEGHALTLCFDLGMRYSQMTIRKQGSDPAAPLVDFPNWEAEAPDLGLYVLDPETGEPTDEVLPKPIFPLSFAALNEFSPVLCQYLVSDDGYQDALVAYVDIRHSKSKRR